MAIKSGQILHDARGFVVDRIQTAGVSNLNIPEEKIYELGNYESVATVRDIPDLSFDLESLDVSTEIEALLTNYATPGSVPEGTEFDFTADQTPMDIISPFKGNAGSFQIVRGIVIPYLTLESATYRFGVRQNATQSFTLRGDSVFYVPGTPYYQTEVFSGSAGPYTLDNTAIIYTNAKGDSQYVLGLSHVAADGTYTRFIHNEDWTNTPTTFTLTAAGLAKIPSNGTLRVVYASATAATYPSTVHEGTDIKPATVRGKDVDVYVSDGAATPVYSRWTGVQSFEVTRRVNIENDEEFGNEQFVSQDFDTAEVSGSITIKSEDPEDLWTKIAQIANVATNVVAGVHTSIPLGIELRINDPNSGDQVKTLYIPDARFTLPSVQGRVQQKLEVTFNFSSDGGTLLVYEGERP